MRIAKESYFLVFLFVFKTLLAFLTGFILVGGIFFIFTLFIIFFFRDPERKIPTVESFIVSPADGRIIQIGREGDDVVRVSIFMSPLDVHVNRIPFGGTILEKKYNPGKFLPAFREKASLLNEQTTIIISTSHGLIRVTQIAGWIARRVVCRVKKGDTVVRGQRFGLIKFGSRVDLYLPQKNTRILVRVGDKVRAGKSMIAYFF